MTYPQQPVPYGQPQQQGYPGQQSYAPPPPQAPAPPYAPPPGYPPQQYQQPYPPQQPQQYYPPQQGYAAQPGPYGQPPQGPPPGPPPAAASLSEFYDQPATGGGPALAFNAPGTRYVGTVTRNVTDADITDATDMITGAVVRYNDGRRKLIMKVPLAIQPSPQYPEGQAVWYVKGNERAELTRAMEEAGVPAADGKMPPPRAGDVLDIVFTHEQPGRRGMNPTKVKRVTYTAVENTGRQQPQAQYQQQQVQPVLPNYNPQPAFAEQQPQVQYQQQPQVQYQASMPAPGTAYQPPQEQYRVPPSQHYQVPQGQQFPPPGAQSPQQPGPYGQPQAEWNPYAQSQQSAPPVGQPAYYDPNPLAMQQYQQPQQGPTPGGPGYGAPPAPPQATATSMAAASPSDVPPPDWPQGVPFKPGLTPAQAALAASMGLANGQVMAQPQ